ncbi:MAG: alpha/beta hydrolase [Chitinophagales bacterium]|nr:alpha/beta hydrolase [Chitinophagales bacterium]
MKSKIIVYLFTFMTVADFSSAQVVSVQPVVNPVTAIPNKRITVKEINLSTGVRLQYAEQGDSNGIPVIFLHGITDSWHSFESVLAHLPSSVHAFAISQRGHGDSERPLDGYTPRHFAADVAAFIKQKKLNKVFVAGHSMGGVHAQQFALDYPELTKGIVIINAEPELKNNPGMPEFYQEVMNMGETISWAFMDGFQRACLSRPIDSAYYKLLVDEGTKVPARVFKSAFTGLMNAYFSERLTEINIPVLVFWGNKDAFFFFKGQEILLNNIKNVKMVVYNTGHALHWEKPEEFATDLVDFTGTINGKKNN